MTELLLIKRPGGSLAPASEDAAEVIGKWKVGTHVLAEVRKPRNPQFHRKFFALLNLAFDCQEAYTEREVFRKAVLLRAGVVELIQLPDGMVVKVPRSIAFARMDEVEFGKVYDRCLTVIVGEFLRGHDEAELRQMVEMVLVEFG